VKATTDFGYALCDIITELSSLVVMTELPDSVSAHLLDKLSTLEHRLSHGVSEKLQLGALVGAFTIARSMMSSTSG
jgi:replication factor C subunit 3/5